MDTNALQPAAPKRRRRWLQFRLRTLLIATMVLAAGCAYFTHECKIVAERRRWLAENFYLPFIEGLDLGGHKAARPSLLRLFLGDEAVASIVVCSKTDAAIAAALFPEAEIDVIK
jgi:hypothetical protein